MKKIILLFAACALCLISCKPIEDPADNGGVKLSDYSAIEVTVGSATGETTTEYGFKTRADFENNFIKLMKDAEGLTFIQSQLDDILADLDYDMTVSYRLIPGAYTRDAMIKNDVMYDVYVEKTNYGTGFVDVSYWNKETQNKVSFAIETIYF